MGEKEWECVRVCAPATEIHFLKEDEASEEPVLDEAVFRK